MKNLAIASILILGCAVLVTGCGRKSAPPPPVPTLEGLTPDLGPRTGGTAVTLKGSNFSPFTTLTLAGDDVDDLTYVDEETMTFTTRAQPGGTDAGVTLRNEGGTAVLLGAFFFIPPPTLVSISPNTGPPEGGTAVTLTGTGFVNFGAGPNTVLIAGFPATDVVAASDTTITCVAPGGAEGSVNVEVTNANGTATLLGGFFYFPPPKVFSVAPAEGSPLGGTAVTVSGSGFTANSPGDNSVAFDGQAATDVVTVDDSTITCVSPTGNPGQANVRVNNFNGFGVLDDAFRYYPYPTLTDVSPSEGPATGGTTITLTGTGFVDNFAGVNTVTVGGASATNVIVIDDTTLTCVTPAGSLGPRPVTVENDNGSATLADAFDFKFSGLIATVGADFYHVNANTAVTSKVGAIGFTPTAMSVHPNGTVYAVTSSELITINIDTGVGTSVASLSPAVTIQDLTFDGSRLFGINADSGQSYEISTSTGTVTNKARFTTTWGTYRHGFQHDGNSTFYYMPNWAFNFGQDAGQIVTVNPDSGSESTGNALNGAHSIYAMGIYQGVIYGIDQQQSSQGSMELVSIDFPNTTAKSIGALPNGIRSLAGTK